MLLKCAYSDRAGKMALSGSMCLLLYQKYVIQQ